MILRVLDRIEESIIAFCIAAATLIIFVAVIHRYGLSNLGQLVVWAKASGYTVFAEWLKSIFFALAAIRLTWAQELCIILFVWMAKFGAAYGVRTGIHVGVDVVVNAVGPALRHVLVLFGLMCGALFSGIVGAFGSRFVWHMFGTGSVSPTLEAPMWLVYLCIPLGSFLMCFRFLQVAWQYQNTGVLPKHDFAKIAGLGEAKERSS